MKKQIWLFAFIAVLLLDIIGIQLHNELLQWISKPLIVPFLGMYFFQTAGAVISPLRKWIVLALFFSWGGDVLLMFQENNELFFLLGLSSFLLAHIFYILFFHFIRVGEQIRSNGWFLLVVVIYYSVLLSWLSPYLGNFKLPVRIYGVIICMMLMMAMHLTALKNQKAGWLTLGGAILFVLSDSVLAVNKFYISFGTAGLVVMLTYGAAQFYLVKGAIEYLCRGNK